MDRKCPTFTTSFLNSRSVSTASLFNSPSSHNPHNNVAAVIRRDRHGNGVNKALSARIRDFGEDCIAENTRLNAQVILSLNRNWIQHQELKSVPAAPLRLPLTHRDTPTHRGDSPRESRPHVTFCSLFTLRWERGGGKAEPESLESWAALLTLWLVEPSEEDIRVELWSNWSMNIDNKHQEVRKLM